MPIYMIIGMLGLFFVNESSALIGGSDHYLVGDHSYIWKYDFLGAIYSVFCVLPYLLILLPVLVFATASIIFRMKETIVSGGETSSLPYFTVIVPAYNEEKVIKNSVGTLLQQNYPRELFRVVVAFNGVDRTGLIAQEMGADVYTTPQAGVGKRNAINYVLDHMPPRIGDAYVLILDADNSVKEDFLLQMAICLQKNNTLAVQANHQPLVVSNNWVSCGLSAAYRASSLLYNEGRSYLCHSALLCGTGFAIREDVFRYLWPKTCTLTEDIELNHLLLRHYNSGVVWAHHACFYDEKPDTLTVAIRQRTRWMVGHFWCALLYTPLLLKEGFLQKNVKMIELACYYLFPFALLGSVLGSVLALIGLSIHVGNNFLGVSYQFQLMISLTLVFVYIFYVVLGDVLTKEFRQTPRGSYYFLRDACYGTAFALAVWPIAIIRASFMLGRQDWIFHTPHKSVSYHEQNPS